MPLEAYAAALQAVAVARMVRQLSEVYSVMRVSTMSELAPFIGFGQVRALAGNAGWRHFALTFPLCPSVYPTTSPHPTHLCRRLRECRQSR